MNFAGVFILIYLFTNSWTAKSPWMDTTMTPCDSTRIHLLYAINSPEHSWLLQNEDNCSLINKFLKTINFEESGKSFIRDIIIFSVQKGDDNLEMAINFYYQVFKPEAFNKPFDQQLWLAQTKNEMSNPRAKMIDDLLVNHLKPGLFRDQILHLLGVPEFDGIQNRFAIALPDSLDACKMTNQTKEERKIRTENVREWIKTAPRQPDTLMIYPVGWDIIDPMFLEILIDGNGQARKFSINQS